MFVGVLFWKHPRRKLYAVAQRELRDCRHHGSRRSYSTIDTSDDESDATSSMSVSTRNKKPKLDKMLETIGDDVSVIRETVTDMMSLTANCNLPLGLQRIIRDTFKCYICHSVPVKPPIIVTKCCENMLGCQECINTWYTGPDAMLKTCPICRTERGCNETMVLRGLTEFLECIRKVYAENDDPVRPAQENKTDQ